MTIILPAGIVCAWQTALAENNHGEWDALASELLKEAKDEPDHGVRDDILTLALVACERADQIMDTVRIFRLDEPERAVTLPVEFERGVLREAAGAMQTLAASLAASNIRMLEEEA